MTIILMAVKQESNGLIEAAVQKENIKVYYTGIGLIAAAQKTTEVICKYQPTRILNLGTAGSRHIPVGALVECVKFQNRTPLKLKMLDEVFQTTAITNLQKTFCGSADHIDLNESADKFEVLDMEAYAIASVCKIMNVNFNSLKYITDDSRGDVSGKWREHLKNGSVALRNQLDLLIKNRFFS